LRYVLRTLLVALATVFWGIAACLMAPFDRTGELGVLASRHWVRWILAICRIDVTVRGLENIDPDQPCVVMSNHQSLVDIAAIVATLPLSFRFVAKRELARIPFFGWGMVAAGHIVIDRGDHAAAVASLQAAAEKVRAGTTVIIFPEGTRNPSGELRPFKSGGFHLALQAGVPILPVTVSGSNHITPHGPLRIEPGPVAVTYGAPIPTAGLGEADREALKQRVRDAILAGFDAALQG
jgi:1-acyl-sn-glycerol-3-phosphate acyltransferase